jgi:hypothetical protein
MPQFNLKPRWESLKVSGRPVGIDRENGILRGYVVAQEGPFKSEGRGEFDQQSLESIVALMNKNASGTKSRFTHPDMSNDGLGKFLGRAHNPAMSTATDERTGKEVKAVRADLHLNKTALETPIEGGKPLGVYVMDLAESDPSALSSSIVVSVDREYRLEKDGTRSRDANGNDLPPLWRPKQIHASDIVDTGDAVDGLLSAGVDVDGLPLAALWRGTELLDSVFADQSEDVVRARLLAWTDRYLSGRFGEKPGVQTIDPRRDVATLRRRLRQRELESGT